MLSLLTSYFLVPLKWSKFAANMITNQMCLCHAVPHLTALLLLVSIMALPVCGRGIFSQDGFGFSGTIRGQPLDGNITMTGFSSWPSGSLSPILEFVGAVFDGLDVWLIPYNALKGSGRHRERQDDGLQQLAQQLAQCRLRCFLRRCI